MKPVFAKVLEGLENEVFLTRIIQRPYFTTEFHFHLECQFTYIVESAGHKVIGDCVESFEPGELTLLGSYIPHVWYNDPATVSSNKQRKTPAKSVALFFNPEKMGELLSFFFSTKKLLSVLDLAKRGMKFYGHTKSSLAALLLQMAEEPPGPSKMILLLQVLQILCTTNEYALLAGPGYANRYSDRDSARMEKIFRYVFANFSTEISLDKAAGLIHMNKQAFCRYFKGRTQRTFVDFVNEVRITQACKLLAAGDDSIGGIAYKCGFNTLSNFNRYFKKIKGTSPRNYRQDLEK
ncbi:AraC family transcriptional regulator [Chitinophaga eiseniae]|uniref:Helix-turn-helix transcriptional regulator n=1 Tax=Chitinophaga eiseniae TaxID=634771 RepID=A0A847SHB9_9BACT|nr:AraC family transcriptional regulator [Chitinophaga eiseniae]NLR78425.1 helix-turn-helix transcriptional regulator [Chitinophaga eiseniae]